MALIGTIRKNFWLVLILLGLALAAFIIMDMMNAGNVGGSGSLTMGKVAGQEIDYREFQSAESALYSQSGDVFGRRNTLWTYFVENAIITKESESMGLNVGRDEMMELQFGTNLSPIVQNNFRDQSTGQVNRQLLLQYKQAIENGDPLNPSFEQFWIEQKKQVKKSQLQTKINNMVTKGIFTPTWMVEEINKINTSTVDFEYVKIPFDQITEEVEVTDAAISDYIKENKAKYNIEEPSRTAKYTVVDVLPTADDTAMWKKRITDLKVEFGASKSDSIFAINNNGFYNPLYASTEELTGDIADSVGTLSVGDVYGPFIDNGAFLIAKLTGKKIVPDSVQASHILRSVQEGDVAGLANAKSFIDSLRTLLESGKAQFDSLAIKNSQDPGSGFKGGDLGYFAQGRMVPEFNNAVFYDSEKGDLHTVVTDFGVHLIKVQDLVFKNRDPKYRLAYILMPITPSEETQNNISDDLIDIISESRTLESLSEVLSTRSDLQLNTSGPLKMNDYIFEDLGSDQTSRDIVRWLYESDTDIGDVSPSIYTYTDNVNYFNSKYVIIGLESINKPGLPSASSMRNQLETTVGNMLKGKALAAKISGSDLNAIASKYNVEVSTATGVSLNSTFVPQLGTEDKIIAKAFKLPDGTVSGPIVGNSGVFVIKPTSHTQGSQAANIPQLRQTTTASDRGQVSFNLIKALKDMYKPEDNRATYF